MKKTLTPVFAFILLALLSCKDEYLILPPEVKEASQVTSCSFNAQWCESYGAHEYLLYVSKHKDFHDHEDGYDGMTVSETSYIVEDLEEDATYYYRLKAIGKDMTSEYSEIMEVKLNGSHAPEVPELYEPTDWAYDGFKLHWEMVTGAEYYQVEISYNEDFTQYVEDSKGIVGVSDTRYHVTELHEDTKYYIRVKAVNGSNHSEYSNVVWVKTPKKECRVVSFYQVDYDGGLNLEVSYDTKIFYDEYGKPSSVCRIATSLEGDLQQTFSYYYEYDENHRLVSMLNKGSQIRYTLQYDEYGKIKKMEVRQLYYFDLSTRLNHTFTYSDDKHFYEEIEGLKGGSDVHLKNEYKLDEWGNIRSIKKYEETDGDWIETDEYYFEYDDKKCPKDMNLLANRELYGLGGNEFAPESHLPFWHKQVCNVTKYGGVSIEYSYNECDYPIRRDAVFNNGSVDLYGNLQYKYKNNCKDKEEEIASR